MLFLAAEREALLLSGDKSVVKTGRLAGLEVRGLLWAFDELVIRGVLPSRLAVIKLREVIKAGAFLPREECERRFNTWSR